MRNAILFVCLIVMGAAVLAPAIAFLPLEPMPGDVALNRLDMHIYVPVVTCLSASVVLTLFFWYMRK